MVTSGQRATLARLRRSRVMHLGLIAAAISLVLARVALYDAGAVEPANEHFQYTWARLDQPVLEGFASRTWAYGPEAFSAEIEEPYLEAPGGVRKVQYFDKARMEITHPDEPVVYPWYVTTGRLADELMTGRLQIGDNTFEVREPADIPVAGDGNDPNGVTYRTLGMFKNTPPVAEGTVYTQRLARDGTVTNDPDLSVYNVAAGPLDPVTNHRVAQPFWEFLNSSGTIYENGLHFEAPLFENPLYLTGRPLTPAFWVGALVSGEPRDVLVQCFERRCMTHTPGNDEGFINETGNVGLHYWNWRYETPGPEPTATPTSPATATPTATATASPTPTATATSTPVDPNAPVDVTVNASVDCDGDRVADGLARNAGADSVCNAYLAGDTSTTVNGNPESSNEIQSLGLNDATDGTITITFDHPDFLDHVIVSGIPYDATAGEIEMALTTGFAASGVPGDAPTVEPISSIAGARLNEAAMRFIFENGNLAGRDVPLMEVDNSPLVGETVAGLFTTLQQGAQSQDEIQELGPNFATSGVFSLRFLHPDAGTITTDPISYDASARTIARELEEAFDEEDVADDTPTVTGGPADTDVLTFTFENGALEGTDVPEIDVVNAALGTTINLANVEVYNENNSLIRTWLVTGAGVAQGRLDPGTYTFTFVYVEQTGEGTTATTGPVQVSANNREFQLIATMSYGE